MLKTPRYYITRPRRRRTGTRKQIVKKELQKEKLNVKGKLAKEGKDSYREILEKFKKELKSCSVTLFNIDVQAAVLTYKPTNKSFLYKISTNSYIFRKSSPRGRKKKCYNMNTKYHGDSKNNTGSSSALQGSRDERQFSQHPVARRQCAKKSTTQLVSKFHPNKSNHSNSGCDDEVMPGKRKRESSNNYHSNSGRFGAACDINRDQALANSEDRPLSRERNYRHNSSLNHIGQDHEESRSQRNNYRDYPSYQDYRDRDKRHDGRRHSEERDRTYQSTRSSQHDDSEYSHSDNSGRSGRHSKRECFNRERSQERVPLWRDGTLSNRGKSRYGRHGDDVSAKPATRSSDSSPAGKAKSSSRDSNPEARYKSSTSNSKTQVQPAFRKAKDKDRDCGNQGDPASATKTGQSHKGPDSRLANSTSDSIKEKKSLTPEPSDLQNPSTPSVTGAVSKTSTSNAPSGPERDRSSETIAETNGINSSHSTEENNIPSASKEAQHELEHVSKSHGIEESSDPLVKGLDPFANGASKLQLDSVNVSSHKASDEEQVKLPKVMPSITNESASKGDTVSSDQCFLEKANLNTLPSVTESSHITSANPEDSFKDVSLHAVVPGERKTKLKGPSLIQENDKTVDLLDLETPDECKSSPARPDSSARETTIEEVDKNQTVDIPVLTRPQLQEVPSPPIKVDPSEGSKSSFRLKLKSIVDKVFPKSNASSVTKDESNLLAKSLPASPKTSGEDIEVESKDQKCKNSIIGLQIKNNEVTTVPCDTAGIPSGQDQLKEPSAVVRYISSVKGVSVLPVCESSMGMINYVDSAVNSEFSIQGKDYFDKPNELKMEGIKETDRAVSYNKDGYCRPKPVEVATNKLADTTGKEDSGLCTQLSGSLSTNLSLDKDCKQAAQTNSLPTLTECLDDRTKITDGSFDQSNSEQVSSLKPLDPAAGSQEPSAMETDLQDSRVRESPLPSDLQAMEVDPLPLEECGEPSGTTTHINDLQSRENSIAKLQGEKESDSQNDIQKKFTVGSVLNLVISKEMSLKPTENKAETNLIPLERPSGPGIDKRLIPMDAALTVGQETVSCAGLEKILLPVPEVGAATTSAGYKVPEEPVSMHAKKPEVAGDTGQCVEPVKPGKTSSLESGKRARSPASEGEERNSNKRTKLVERVKGDQGVAEDSVKDPEETMQPVKTAVTSSEPVASPQSVKTVVKSSEPVATRQPVKIAVSSSEPVATPQPVKIAVSSLEPVASPQPVKTSPPPVKTVVKSSEPVASPQPVKKPVPSSEPVAPPQPVKIAVSSSEPVASLQPVNKVVKSSEPVATPQPVKVAVSSSEPVATPQPVKIAVPSSKPVASPQPVKTSQQPVKTAVQPSESVASAQPVKTAAKPSESLASPSKQVEKAEPVKPGTVPRKSSATPPLSQAPSQSGAPPPRRTGKPKQMTTKDLKLMIEKHAQASLQAQLKHLHRQLEVSSRGERTWETRSVELQKQLEIVQGDFSKVKEEGDSMRAEIAELHSHVENLTQKLLEKNVAVNKASSATQYDSDDFAEVGEAPAGVISAERLPVSNPIIVISDARQQPLESGIKQTPSSLNVDASMKVAEAPNVANATIVSSAGSDASPLVALLCSRPEVTQPEVQPQSTTQESIPAVSAGPSATPNLGASKETASVGDVATQSAPPETDSASSQQQMPPTMMICLEKPDFGTTGVLPQLTQQTLQGISNSVASVQVTASSGALTTQTAAPDTTAVVTNTEVALVRKAPTPEVQEIELPPRSTPGKQVVPLPRVRQSQSPQTRKTGSPGAQTPPRGLIPITSQLARTTTAINVSVLPNVKISSILSKSTRPQKVTTPVTKQQTSMQSAVASQKAAPTSQANRKTEPELIDLTDDIEEPSSSIAKQPAVKAPQGTPTIASMIQQQSTGSKRAPPSYVYHQTSTGQIHNAAPSNTQGSIARRPAQQQEGQSPHKPATQMVRPHAQQPRPQAASPRHFTGPPPNRTVGGVRYRMPAVVNPRPGTSRLSQVNPTVSAVSVPQASAHSTLNSTPVSLASTSVRYINPALMANVSMALNHSFANTNTLTAVSQHTPIATVTAYPMSAQQIRSVAPILQGMSVPIVTQALNNPFFPSAVQAGIPAGRLPQQAQGVRTPQNTIAATQVVTQMQQQQMQHNIQLQQQQQQQQLLQKHQAQQQQAQQQQTQQQQAQQQQAQQQQAQQQVQQQQALQQQQIQQQLLHQRLQQHQQKARAAEEQRQQASQQQQMQQQLQQQQVNRTNQQQLQVQQQAQKLQNHQLHQKRAHIQMTVQKVHSTVLDLKKKLENVNKDLLTVQAKLHNKENMTYRQRDLEMQIRHLDSQKQQLQSEITKNLSLQQQQQQAYERLMGSINSTAMNANPIAATNLGPPSHPAPLPALPPSTSKGPPKPELNITKVETGIVLSWNMTLDVNDAQIDVYHLYAYQESEAPATTTLWKKIGEVRALPLPMACTLTMFQAGSVYHFAVCAVDVQGQSGPFSEPSSINLPRN